MSSLKIKICGVTNLRDAVAAAELGADFIGLIFVPASVRKVELKLAQEIVQAVGSKCKTVGVFQNAEPDEIKQIRKVVGFDIVQLHGHEVPQMVAALKPAIKVMAIDGGVQLSQLAQYKEHSEFLLFDRPKSLDDDRWLWRTLNALELNPISIPFLFAGGLTPTNVSQAIQLLLKNSGFKGVDVASAIESSPGIKDHKKMESFFQAVKEVPPDAIKGPDGNKG